MSVEPKKPKVAVHKFSSCDGCQLALLNLGESILMLSSLVDIVYFAEAGPLDDSQAIDIAFVEGSISTPEDLHRINKIRAQSTYLIAIGACANTGGVQALRNRVDADMWKNALYPSPEYLSLLADSTSIAGHVNVDLEVHGCPVTSNQILAVIQSLLLGIAPHISKEKVCLECKRQGNVCVMVTRQALCMGAVTATGCDALCPSFQRACYGCFGPTENMNTASLGQIFNNVGVPKNTIAHRMHYIHSADASLNREGNYWLKKQDD